MKTGIVVLNYNDFDTTREFIEKIKDYKILDLIVVVDNNSTDNSYEKLKQYESNKIKVINANINNGYSYGNNVGCRYLTKNNIDYIIVSNPDIIVEEQDIVELIKKLEDENIAMIGPTILEKDTLNRGWKFPSVVVDSLSNLSYFGNYFKKLLLYKQGHYEKDILKVDVVSGCFFIIKKEVLERIGFFDENVFLYYEENILAKEINKIGLNIVVDNNVKIIHNHSVSIDKVWNKINKFKILNKSKRYYHKKYNKCNIFGFILLYTTYYISLGISYVLAIFKR